MVALVYVCLLVSASVCVHTHTHTRVCFIKLDSSKRKVHLCKSNSSTTSVLRIHRGNLDTLMAR